MNISGECAKKLCSVCCCQIIQQLGQDGLDATRIILQQAAAHLNPGGLLVVEIGHNRDALEATLPDLPFNWLDVSAGNDFVFLLHREELP
jgi:ribosomal protein L3 glutamine methyltransferase